MVVHGVYLYNLLKTKNKDFSYSFGSDQEVKQHRDSIDFSHTNDLLNHMHRNFILHEK